MAVEQRITRARSTSNRFADETPQQIAQHREIGRRHSRRRNDTNFLARLRVAELERFFAINYGDRQLPDDDAGRADLRLMADHLAQLEPRLIRPWAAAWMKTLPANELDGLIAEVGNGRRWKADALARELGLDDATRTRLKIRTIGAVDCSKAKRMTRRRRKRIATARASRAKAGAHPHAKSAESLMPWVEAGISRATYYRRRRAQINASETVETETRPIVRSTYTGKNQSYGSLASTSEPGRGHGAKASTFTAEPLSSCSSRVRQPCVQVKTDPIAGLDNVAFRAVHAEHYELLSAVTLNFEQKARLNELAEIIEIERERRSLIASDRQGGLGMNPSNQRMRDDPAGSCMPPLHALGDGRRSAEASEQRPYADRDFR